MTTSELKIWGEIITSGYQYPFPVNTIRNYIQYAPPYQPENRLKKHSSDIIIHCQKIALTVVMILWLYLYMEVRMKSQVFTHPKQ